MSFDVQELLTNLSQLENRFLNQSTHFAQLEDFFKFEENRIDGLEREIDRLNDFLSDQKPTAIADQQPTARELLNFIIFTMSQFITLCHILFFLFHSRFS